MRTVYGFIHILVLVTTAMKLSFLNKSKTMGANILQTLSP